MLAEAARRSHFIVVLILLTRKVKINRTLTIKEVNCSVLLLADITIYSQ